MIFIKIIELSILKIIFQLSLQIYASSGITVIYDMMVCSLVEI
jgi:hypothetical protein